MLVSFSMFPTDKGESVSRYVAKIINFVDRSGLPYRTSAMSTVVEGSWDRVFKLIKKCRDSMAKESSRIYMVITVDDRKKARNRLTGKVNRIEQRLKRKISR